MSPHQLSVVPEEARPVQGRPAGLVSRSVAGAVDVVVVAGVLLGGFLGWQALRFLVDPRHFTFGEARLLLGLAAACGACIVYLTAGWALTGRTYGDHVMGLMVVDRRGRRPRLWTALLRACLYTAFPIGLVWSARGGTHASLQDALLGTRVVYSWDPHESLTPRSSTRGEAPPRQPAGA